MSVYIKDSQPDEVGGVHLWRATIMETATELTQQVRVNLPDFDPYLLWGPCKWQPRVYPEDVIIDTKPPTEVTACLILMPQKGDYALVLLDNVREAWIVSWWPAAYGGVYAYS